MDYKKSLKEYKIVGRVDVDEDGFETYYFYEGVYFAKSPQDMAFTLDEQELPFELIIDTDDMEIIEYPTEEDGGYHTDEHEDDEEDEYWWKKPK